MRLETMRNDATADFKRLEGDMVRDFKAECAHIADPAQCGNIVQRHFNGLMMTLLLFVAMALLAAVLIYRFS